MRLVKLLFCDIYRDGGSFGASFATSEGGTFSLELQCSDSSPVNHQLAHRWLFAFPGTDLPPERIPLVTGSDDELRLFALVDAYLQSVSSLSEAPSGPDVERLVEMRHYMAIREPSFPNDLRLAGFIR